MLDSFTLERFHLQEIEEPVGVLHEVANKLRDIPEFLNLQKVLTEKPIEIHRHEGSLLNRTRPATHH